MSEQQELLPAETVPEQPKPKKAKPVIEFGERGLVLRNTTDLLQFADLLLAEGLAPKGLRTRGQVVIALQAGTEVGLTPMQALKYVAPINGSPTIWGEGAKGLVEASGLLAGWDERWDDGDTKNIGDPDPNKLTDGVAAVTTLSRKGGASVTRTFSVADAKKARLWGKAGPWTEYPLRMLRVRSMAWAMRDLFADCLGGLAIREEMNDYAEAGPAVTGSRSVDEIGPKTTE